MLKIVGIDVILFVVIMLVMVTLSDKGLVSPVIKQSSTVERIIQYSFEVKNTDGRVSKNVDFWAYAPVKKTTYQRLIKLDVSFPYDLIEDELGNQIIHIHFDYIPPFATNIVDIQAMLEMSDVPNIVEENNLNRFLQSEKYIESSNPSIQELSKGFSINNLSEISQINDWVTKHIHGEAYVRENRGALYALQEQKGDCTEYAYLFTALCRAKGLPARVLGGYVMSENGKLTAGSYHNWAEFYSDGAWHIADPQGQVFLDVPFRFITMNILSSQNANPMGEYQRFKFTGKHVSVIMR